MNTPLLTFVLLLRYTITVNIRPENVSMIGYSFYEETKQKKKKQKHDKDKDNTWPWCPFAESQDYSKRKSFDGIALKRLRLTVNGNGFLKNLIPLLDAYLSGKCRESMNKEETKIAIGKEQKEHVF